MGMPIGFSSSSYDSDPVPKYCSQCGESLRKVQPRPAPQPNPNPSNFSVMNVARMKELVIARVKYHDCTNYEGHKILVYHREVFERCSANGKLDPHFAETGGVSPIARFAPTKEGWKMAMLFVQQIWDD